MKAISFVFFFLLVGLFSCQVTKPDVTSMVIGIGQMPNITKDNSNNFHLVYGNGDSILYSYSSDKGQTFSSPALVSIVSKLAASHMRGPQIAATTNELVITACNETGDIFSFTKDLSGSWIKTARVNDMDTTARENLMALAADRENAFAVWLDLRGGQNKIFGARSTDGGKTWSKNLMIYTSPDITVCECCKPSVVMAGNNVYVMFRNWLDGNRDPYMIRSSDAGINFSQAQKLGKGSWALNGCPMDGGAITINEKGNPETVWNRKGVIYACEPGKEEKELGTGRHCTIESINGKNVYAWTENGEVMLVKPQGMKKNLGKGDMPSVKAINNDHVICVWEKDKHIHRAIVGL
jgi:hypothetical protein